MSTPPLPPRSSAVLRMPARKGLVGAYTTSIVNAMTGNAFFPSPTPPLATVSADLAAYEASEATVVIGVKGATVTRNAKLAALHADLSHLMAYVQLVADENPTNAPSIIESAGFSLRKKAARAKSDLKVEPTGVPGSVKLMARAIARRASYEWQTSTDQKTWIDAPSTIQAKTVLVGLTVGTLTFFRFRGVTKTGEGAYSQVVQLVVS